VRIRIFIYENDNALRKISYGFFHQINALVANKPSAKRPSLIAEAQHRISLFLPNNFLTWVVGFLLYRNYGF